MSHFNKNVWAVFPLLSILSLSPAELQFRHQASRFLASVEDQKEIKHPRFEKLISKVDKKNPVQDISQQAYFDKAKALIEQIKKERESFKKNLDKKEEVALQRKKLEALVSEIVVLGEELEILKQKKLLNEKDEKVVVEDFATYKDLTEGLLKELETNEGLVAKAEKPVEEPKKEEEVKTEVPVVAETPKTETPKTETPKTEDPKAEAPKEETPVAQTPSKEEPSKEGPAKEESKEEPVKVADKDKPAEEEKKEECAEDKPKVLPPVATDLYAQQMQILQQMMGMNQMMMMMLQQQQLFQMQQHFQLQGPVNQQAYQYVAPTQGGSWVFQPNGGQRPGFYPDQVQQQQPPHGFNGWGMAPNQYFADPSWNPMPMPGQFGGAPITGFNMGPVNMGAPMGPMMVPPMAPPVAAGPVPMPMPVAQPPMQMMPPQA